MFNPTDTLIKIEFPVVETNQKSKFLTRSSKFPRRKNYE